MSDSSFESDGENSSPKNTADCITEAMNRKPVYLKKSKSKANFQKLKSRLQKNNVPAEKKRSNRIDQRKELNECYSELQSDLTNLSNKFQLFHECITEIFDQIECLENRVEYLEENSKTINSSIPEDNGKVQSYSAAVQSDCTQRIAKLEFMNSEEERKKRSLEVLITHLDLDPANENLSTHVSNFLRSKLNMGQREIDSNMMVKKGSRENTAHLTLSHKRFKGFLYKAKKQLRVDNNIACNDLFINDNLTTYNFHILMSLKTARKSYPSTHNPIKSVYCHEGRVFLRLNGEEEGRHIKTHADKDIIVKRLPSPSRASSHGGTRRSPSRPNQGADVSTTQKNAAS